MNPTENDLNNRFAYHPPPNELVKDLHQNIRTSCLVMARVLVGTLPAGWEQSLALTKLEELMFWANAAIARNHAWFAEPQEKA